MKPQRRPLPYWHRGLVAKRSGSVSRRADGIPLYGPGTPWHRDIAFGRGLRNIMRQDLERRLFGSADVPLAYHFPIIFDAPWLVRRHRRVAAR